MRVASWGIQHSEKLERIQESLARILESLAYMKKLAVSTASPSPYGSNSSNREIESLRERMSQLSMSERDVTKEQAILRSLSFESRPIRHRSIVKAHKETFRWVFQDSHTNGTGFAPWLENGSGIFWISGKAGLWKVNSNEVYRRQ